MSKKANVQTPQFTSEWLGYMNTASDEQGYKDSELAKAWQEYEDGHFRAVALKLHLAATAAYAMADALVNAAQAIPKG